MSQWVGNLTRPACGTGAAIDLPRGSDPDNTGARLRDRGLFAQLLTRSDQRKGLEPASPSRSRETKSAAG